MTSSPPPDFILKMDPRISPNRIPPLPNLSFDIALQIFTDISLRPPGATSASRTDNEVLATVGQSACHAIITTHLFQRKPALSAEEIEVCTRCCTMFHQPHPKKGGLTYLLSGHKRWNALWRLGFDLDWLL
jgi:hypothetical protein